MTPVLKLLPSMWAANLSVFENEVAQAHELTIRDPVAGNIQMASLWYSRSPTLWDLVTLSHRRWRRYATDYVQTAIALLGKRGSWNLSAGQYDILATIRKRSDPADALAIYEQGLALTDLKPHERGLFLVGKAEALHALHRYGYFACAKQAVDAGSIRITGQDKVLAMRQYSRILRRAALVMVRNTENRELAYRWYRQAMRIAADFDYGSKAQRKILRLYMPVFAMRWLGL